MTRAEIIAHNRGVLAVTAVAETSASALRRRLVEKPTRFSYAIAALDAIVEAGNELVLPLLPDEPDADAAAMPRPRPPLENASVQAEHA